jgi:HJR/Mrr/RecB family endonuclease
MVLDQKGLQQLSPSDFEALVACLYRHKQYRAVLTSRSSDGGADVVAVKPEEVILVQAKHSSKSNAVTPLALGDIIGAQSIYQTKVPRRLRLHVVTNAHFDAACAMQAGQHGITLIDGTRLRTMIDAAGTTLGDIAAANAARAVSFADGLKKIQALL